MNSITIAVTVNTAKEKVVNGFNLKLFNFLSAGFPPVQVLRFDGCSVGNEVHLLLGPKPFGSKWISQITEATDTDLLWQFVDVGVALPFPLKRWRHTHSVLKISNSETKITDHMEFSSGLCLLDALLKPMLYAIFVKRKGLYKRFFEDEVS